MMRQKTGTKFLTHSWLRATCCAKRKIASLRLVQEIAVRFRVSFEDSAHDEECRGDSVLAVDARDAATCVEARRGDCGVRVGWTLHVIRGYVS